MRRGSEAFSMTRVSMTRDINKGSSRNRARKPNSSDVVENILGGFASEGGRYTALATLTLAIRLAELSCVYEEREEQSCAGGWGV
jgi:hypothetical protein